MTEKLYAVAASVIMPDAACSVESQAEGCVRLSAPSTGESASTDITIRVVPGLLWAKSDGEAREEALELARRRFPPSEGWVNHSVILSLVEPDFILEAAAKVKEMMKPEGDDEGLLM
jgi:hypothetical protein